MEGRSEDLDEVFASFAEVSFCGTLYGSKTVAESKRKDDLLSPYDFDLYAKRFFPVAERLESQAAEAEDQGDTKKASELYLRAACVYRTAKQPAPSCDTQRLAWHKQRAVYYKGAKSVHALSSVWTYQVADKLSR